ncbi:hypothetical protein FRB94_000480 [Tulasnella sp. JGI-2019a]|nr:hypothetical protein FRB94_000480 [Tulasnella sp. JGI-2019a]
MTLAWKHGQGKELSIKGLDPDSMPPIQDPGQETNYFEVNAVSMHWHQPNLQIPYQGDTYLNTTLICHGLLSSAPVSPSMAISLRTLEAHRLYHLVHPSLSIQLLTKALCLSHQQPYHPHLHCGLSDTFNIYLSILWLVDSKVQLALLRNMPDWQLMHTCLLCMYKLEEEDQLDYSLLFAMNSGSSLKRFTDLSLVPSWKKATHKRRKRGGDTRNDDDDANAEMEMKGGLGPTAVDTLSIDATLPTLEGIISGCMERWKANAPDEKKGMFSCYDESGIFISVCRHGHILVVADMVQSGELTKYPLAILAKLQAIFPGSKLGVYNIGCTAAGTVERSSIRPSMNLCFVIPAMHGYAHNQACQLNHHPNYTAGTRLEDFETCKRTFASSNGCARTMQHATAFHQHQTIDMHYHHWDNEKYASLGTFMLNNYRQALHIISEHGNLMQQVLTTLCLSGIDFQCFLHKEALCLSGLKKELEVDTIHVAYVQAIDAHAVAVVALQVQVNITQRQAEGQGPSDWPNDVTATMICSLRPINRAYTVAQAVVNWCLDHLEVIKIQLQIDVSWTTQLPEYLSMRKYACEQTYHLTLDHLEKSVVQQLFELQKAGLESTGYKIREHIAKQLKTHSETIRNHVNAYNATARTLPHLCPVIDFKTVIHYAFLGKFNLLQDAHEDICEKQWAKPEIRIVMD